MFSRVASSFRFIASPKLLDAAALSGGAMAATVGIYDVADGRPGNLPASNYLAAATGIAAASLIGARRFMPGAMGPRMAAVGGLMGISGTGMLFFAPGAIADTKPSDPNYGWGHLAAAPGVGVPLPPIERSTAGIAAPASKPDIVDWTARVGKSGEVAHRGRRADGSYKHNEANVIMLHATGGGKPGSTKDQTVEDIFQLFSGATKASAHFVIGRDGTIAQLVPTDQRAWHVAGDGANNLWNTDAIGIELINDNSGSDPYSPAQLEAARSLVQYLSHENNIPLTHVMMHRHVQDDRYDPVGFDFHNFLNVLDDTDPIGNRVQGIQTEQVERLPDGTLLNAHGPGGDEQPSAPSTPTASSSSSSGAWSMSTAVSTPTDTATASSSSSTTPATSTSTSAPTEALPTMASEPTDSGAEAPTPEPSSSSTAGTRSSATSSATNAPAPGSSSSERPKPTATSTASAKPGPTSPQPHDSEPDQPGLGDRLLRLVGGGSNDNVEVRSAVAPRDASTPQPAPAESAPPANQSLFEKLLSAFG